MKAWRVHELGEPHDVLTLDEVETPRAAGGEVVVRVLGAATNFADALLCRGEYQVRPPLPFTPGIEVCGEVVEVGSGASRWQVGDRVVGTPELPTGSYAEYAVVHADKALPAPAALDDAAAAALLIGYQTGWFALHRRAAIQPGEWLLVHAAAGGVGSAAVQLGKAAGARVVGVAGGGEKAELVRRLGADVVLDRRTDDIVEAVKEVTGGRGADVVYDPVGGEAYDLSTKCIAFEGRILVIGFAGGRIQAPPLNHALVKNYSVLGLHWGLYVARRPDLVLECHRELTRLADEGLVAPYVSERVPLTAVPDAVTRVASGRTVGRLVVTP